MLAALLLTGATPAAAKILKLPVYVPDLNAVPVVATDHFGINRSWAVADADGDGLDDVFHFGTIFDSDVQNNPPEPVTMYHNLGNGHFEYVNDYASIVGGNPPDIQQARQIIAGELNGDNRRDVVFANYGSDYDSYDGEEELILLTNAQGQLEAAGTAYPQFDDTTHAAAIGDIDGDGDNDILMANVCCGARGSYFLINDGQGNFTLDDARLPVAFRDAFTVNFMSAEFMDADGDGHLDLVAGFAQRADEENPEGIRTGAVLLNDGTGDFSDAEILRFPAGLFGDNATLPLDFVVYDVDGDGNSDVFVSEAYFDGGGAKVQVLLGNGDGTFRDESFRIQTSFPYLPGGPFLWIERLEMIDFDGNAALDLLVQMTDSGIPKTTIFVNNGDGFFTEVPDQVLHNVQNVHPGILPYYFFYPVVTGGKLYLIASEYVNEGVTTPVFSSNGSTVDVDLNFPPGARDDAYKVLVNNDLAVSSGEGVLANDVEPDGQTLLASLVAPPANGSVALATDGGFNYMPNAGFSGHDSFTYRVSDGGLTSNTAMVEIDVGANPMLVPILQYLLDQDAAP